jgi:hypothetical protein
VLALGVIALAAALGVTALAFSDLFMAEGAFRSSGAELAAEAGARDALVRIARDKSYTCPGDACYSISAVPGGCATNEGCASVSVSSGTGAAGDPKVIRSTGRSRSIVRTIEAEVIFDAELRGQIQNVAWREL